MKIATLAVVLLIVQAAHAQRRPAGKESADTLTVSHCVVSLLDEVQVPSSKPGVIRGFAVEESTRVQEGQLLCQLDFSEAQARLLVAERELIAAKKQSENDIDVRYARAASAVAKAELAAAMEANRAVPGSVAATEVRRLQLAEHRANLGIEQAQYDFDIAKVATTVRESEVDVAKLEVELRKIRSPVTGIVVRTYRHRGEWVNAGDPICHVVRLDRMRVTGFVSISQYEQSQVLGRKVTVTVNLANGKSEHFDGHIGFASPLVEADGNYRVWVELANRETGGYWVLLPGRVAEMEIDLKSPAAMPQEVDAALPLIEAE